MKPCDHLPQYLDGRLERAGREYFESHLGICSDCRKLTDLWVCSKNVLKNEAGERQRYLVPTDDEASRLVQRAQLDASSRGFFSVRVLVPLTACVSFAAAFFIATYFSFSSASSSVPQIGAPLHTALVEKARPVESAEELPADSLTLEYETKQYGRTTGRLGNDRFGLAAMSKIHVVSTEGMTTLLQLDHGVAAFSVSKRKGGRKFVVQAGDYRVEVVGTRFTVDHSDEGIRVAVTEGIVAVSEKSGRKWRLTGGEALTASPDGSAERTMADREEIEETARLLDETAVDESALATLTPVPQIETGRASISPKRAFGAVVKRRSALMQKTTPIIGTQLSAQSAAREDTLDGQTNTGATKSADVVENPKPESPHLDSEPQGIDLWRRWVLEGRFEAAETALDDHLSEHPMDTDAYSLLADCRRKAGKYIEAVETYKKLTAIAGDYQANRARFKAGVLLQENLKNHLGAAAIFDEYLSTGKGTPLLRAKAAIRLASSLIELGETERAKKLLSKIVDDYGGSSVAIQAREVLNKIN